MATATRNSIKIAADSTELSAVEKRRAYQKARRERLKQEQEAAGLVAQKGFMTADGATFRTKKEAARHIAYCKFQTHVAEEGKLLYSEGGVTQEVPSGSLALWLEMNRAQVLEVLKSVKG